MLEPLGMPINEWFPAAATPEASLLNAAFDENGPTAAAVAMATATPEDSASVRPLGVWNGEKDAGGATYTTY